MASEQSRLDCVAICKLGLRAKVCQSLMHSPQSLSDHVKVLTHIRCHMDDARIAVETGVDGV